MLQLVTGSEMQNCLEKIYWSLPCLRLETVRVVPMEDEVVYVVVVAEVAMERAAYISRLSEDQI